MAFLPVEVVPAGMQLFKARCLDEAAPLLEYFDQTYVSGKYVQRRRRNFQPGIPTVNLRCIQTKFIDYSINNNYQQNKHNTQ